MSSANYPDSLPINSAVDVSHFIDMINQTQQALALLDPNTGSIEWCSRAWWHSLPESVDTLRCPAIQGFLNSGNNSATLVCEWFATPSEVTVSRLSSGLIALQLHDCLLAEHDMHVYMQARESMFTISRTISVSEMATTLAHEIKQPVATIINIMNGLKIMLKQGLTETPSKKMEDALDSVLEQANFTNSVINRIRDFTQARRPQQVDIEITALLRESLSLMDWLLNANQCSTELVIVDEPLICRGDPTMLQQVLINLLRNGVEAMLQCKPDDRHLVIECVRKHQSVVVSIKDSGHGLSGKENSLFVPFSSSKANGMGVGLNICRSFIELHQGRLWLSPNADVGCTSNVELPLLMADEVAA